MGDGQYVVRGNVLVVLGTGAVMFVLGAAFLFGGIGGLLSLAARGLSLDNVLHLPLSALALVLGVRMVTPGLVALCPPWQGIPMVTVDAAGVELPAVSWGKSVRVSWAEIAGIGIVDGRDVRWQTTGTALPVVGAAAEFVSWYWWSATPPPPHVADPARWKRPLPGSTLVILSLAARSPAQAAEFARVRDELEELARAIRTSGRHRVADDLVSLTGWLAHWQHEWSGVAQRYGIVAAVPTRRLDRERLARAVRACSGRGLSGFGFPGPDALHTPQSVAEQVRSHATFLVPVD